MTKASVLSTMHKTSLYLFSNDLRVDHNPALKRAALASKQLVCAYVIEKNWFLPNRYGLKSLGQHRWRFLYESLMDLQTELEKLGQKLLIVKDSYLDAVSTLITQYDISAVYRSENTGYYENQRWELLINRYPQLRFVETASHTIFDKKNVPFDLDKPPSTFSKFRNLVEPLSELSVDHALMTLPPSPPFRASNSVLVYSTDFALMPKPDQRDLVDFKGGASAGRNHLATYFSSMHPSEYKQVRNELDGWYNSSKFSPWLANGCLSAALILTAIDEYEASVEKNESTYWIRFELLWREYFQWLAHAIGRQLFDFKGLKDNKPLTSFYSERFQRWCQGDTPYPIVNACMKQLNMTGYMSNRGRQIVASCFVNELNLDWRYGAAYFEQQLIDYDVAVNWGNWQYLAGVDVDPRGQRHFNLEKQTSLYDPDGAFVTRWDATTPQPQLDSVDAADWPLMP